MQKKLIVVTGGGTAGHVFPAFPVIERLDGWQVLWIGSRRGMERELVTGAGLRYVGVPSGKLRRYWSWKNVTDVLSIALGFVCSVFVLLRYRPVCVFAKGGYVSVPPVAAARLLGLRVWAHESDVSPGLATRISLAFGARAVFSWEQTKAYVSGKCAERAVVVGNPVRDIIVGGDRERGRRFAGLEDDRPLVLVLGGSLGAAEINGLVWAVLGELLEHCAIVHQTGASGGEGIADGESLGTYVHAEFFSDELPDLLAAADLAVSRAGAGLVWELAATGTPAYYIPLREHSRGDQVLNASLARDAGMGFVAGEGLNEQKFLSDVLSLVGDKSRLADMRKACLQFPAMKAADELASLIVREVG